MKRQLKQKLSVFSISTMSEEELIEGVLSLYVYRDQKETVKGISRHIAQKLRERRSLIRNKIYPVPCQNLAERRRK